jgi:hypothetical protein
MISRLSACLAPPKVPLDRPQLWTAEEKMQPLLTNTLPNSPPS